MNVTDNPVVSTSTKVIVLTVKEEKQLRDEIDKLSSKYGMSSSTVIEIIKCEGYMYGNNKHINYHPRKDGSVSTSTDYGPLQINDYYHEEDMKKINLDIKNKWDSLEYGFILMKEQGLFPWNASKHCWLPKIN